MTRMTEEEMKNEVKRLAPFYHRLDLPYGLSTYIPEQNRRPREYTRLRSVIDHAFPNILDACGGSLEGKRVLDVGCNCGGFSIEAAEHNAESVLGFDVVDHYIEQANFIKRALQLDQAEFMTTDVDGFAESNTSEFDVTFCFGILYHFEDPIRAMRALSAVTKSIMVVDTNLQPIPALLQRFLPKRLWAMRMNSASTPESDHITANLWKTHETVKFVPTEATLVRLMKILGFKKIKKIQPKVKGLEDRYHDGRRGTFIATR